MNNNPSFTLRELRTLHRQSLRAMRSLYTRGNWLKHGRGHLEAMNWFLSDLERAAELKIERAEKGSSQYE